MEFKGIAWAGNIYDKFEAMCLEVEEVIYEDTVKYMENQVQKVGASVKKFYSEVMQDLLPPSCIDPVKVAAADLSLNPYAHADNNKKPKLCALESQGGELKKKETSNVDNCDLTSKESSASGPNDTNSESPQSCRVFVESTCPVPCSAKSKKLGAYKRPIGIKRISETNRPLRSSSPSLSTERSCMVMCEARRGREVASTNLNVTRPSMSSPELDPEEVKTELASPASNKFLSVESLRQDKDNSECTSSSQGVSAEDTSFSLSGLSVTTNACNTQSLGIPTAVTSYEDKPMQYSSCSQIHPENISSATRDVESADEGVAVSYEENFGMEIIDSEEIAESGVEVSPSFVKSKLDETCVLVEGDMLHLLYDGSQKHNSYKKKFREAVSAKLRPPRKQNRSISRHKDLDGKNNTDAVMSDLTMNSDCKTAPAQDSFGSEWELI